MVERKSEKSCQAFITYLHTYVHTHIYTFLHTSTYIYVLILKNRKIEHFKYFGSMITNDAGCTLEIEYGLNFFIF